MADEEKKETARQKVKAQMDRFFAGIGKLTRVQRLLICLVTLAVMGIGYYYLIFAPKEKVLSAAKTELQTQKQKLETYKIKASSLKKFEKKMAEVQAEFDQAMKALPDKKEVPSLLIGISKAGKSAGLEFQLFQPEAEVNKDFYKEIPLSMTVTGSYHQAADFFFQVARLNRIVNIQDLTMENDSKARGKVQMKCSAVTYMFSEQATPPNKGQKGKKR